MDKDDSGPNAHGDRMPLGTPTGLTLHGPEDSVQDYGLESSHLIAQADIDTQLQEAEAEHAT